MVRRYVYRLSWEEDDIRCHRRSGSSATPSWENSTRRTTTATIESDSPPRPDQIPKQKPPHTAALILDNFSDYLILFINGDGLMNRLIILYYSIWESINLTMLAKHSIASCQNILCHLRGTAAKPKQSKYSQKRFPYRPMQSRYSPRQSQYRPIQSK